MGDGLESYRVRIGLYVGSKLRIDSTGRCEVSVALSKDQRRGWDLKLMLSALAVLQILLIIGNVESNPGPVFKCLSCDYRAASTQNYVDHLSVHKQNSNFLFRCPVIGCSSRFSNHNAFRTHINRTHSDVTEAKRQQLDYRTCQDTRTQATCTNVGCKDLVFSTSADLRKHLYEHIRNGMRVYCPFPPGSCSHTTGFIKETTLSYHLSAYHKSSQILHPTPLNIPPLVTQNLPSSSTSSMDIEPESAEILDTSDELHAAGDDDLPNLYSSKQIEEFIAKLYLKWESKFHIPASTVQSISEDLALLSEMSHHQIRNNLMTQLLKEGILRDQAQKISSECLKSDTFFNVHHKGLSDRALVSSYFRSNYYRKNFSYVDPEELTLGVNSLGLKRFAQYVPIKKTIQVILHDTSVQKQVSDSFQRQTPAGTQDKNILSDYFDGQVFLSSVASKCKSLHLMLFIDACEIVNPLGAARTHYKLCCVYYTLGNLDAKFRSKVDTLQLAMVLFDKDLKEFSPNHCLERLTEDLKELEINGVDFMGRSIPVYLVSVIGDNLGQHEIGGFVCNFQGQYWCRYCDISKSEFLKNPSLTHVLRTAEHYSECLRLLREEQCVDKNIKHHKGIVTNSPFNELSNFHVCAPGLCPCLAHDLFLGVVANDLWLFIRYFVKKGWFTLQCLNKLIQDFDFKGPDARDRPAKVHVKLSKLKGSAVQNWNMLRFLGLLVGHCPIDCDDPVWQLYIKLKTITEFVSSPRISAEQVMFLRDLVTDYLSARSSCPILASFKGYRLLPKHHFLAHYPELIILLGPLIRLWTLKFEAKHSWLRNAALACKNFIHVSKTVANRHQLFFAYNCTGQMFSNDPEFKFSTPLDMSQCTNSERAAISKFNIKTEHVLEVNIVSVFGTTYKRGLFMILRKREAMLTVGRIHKILYSGDDDSVYFVCQEFSSEYNPGFGHYEVKGFDLKSENFVSVKLEDLPNYYPLSAYLLKTTRCLSLKHSIVDDE